MAPTKRTFRPELKIVKKRPLKNPEDLHRSVVMKQRDAIIAGFKNFMLANDIAEIIRSRKNDTIMIKHIGLKRGVYHFGPNLDDKNYITFDDIMENIPLKNRNELNKSKFRDFAGVIVRIRPNHKTFQVNIHPSYVTDISVRGTKKTYRVSHNTINLWDKDDKDPWKKSLRVKSEFLV